MSIFKNSCRILTLCAGIATGLFHTTAAFCDWSDCQPNYSCQPTCCEDPCGHFFVRGDLLYWKPHVSGLELDFGSGSMAQTIVDDVQIITTSEYDVDPHGKWDPGYRIAAGYRFACSGWEIDAFWTDFQGSASRNVSEDALVTNTGKYRVKLQQIDVALAYNASIAPCFTVKPFVGIRGTKIHQSVHAVLVTDITLSPTSLATETRTLADKQNYYGIGPVLGLQANWDIGYGFGIYGTAAAGLLYGDFKVHFDDTDVFTAPLSKEVFSTDKRHLHAFDCNIDLALGISWQTCFFDSYQLLMKLGFEHHEYFNQSRIGANRGDLSFDGGIFSLCLAF